MNKERWSVTLRQFQRRNGLPFAGALSDGELLNRFVHRNDEPAFEALTWRHCPMVLSTCRRVLGRLHDAEDAFQATFLVLFRKAKSIGKRGSVAAWLHRVAYRVSLRLQAKRSRLPASPKSLDDLPAPAIGGAGLSSDLSEFSELAEALDQEVNRLPDRYRVPLVLCALQGRSYEQAAREIGCPLGTIQSRLARAKERLRIQLTQRGLQLTAIALAAITGSAAAEAPPALVYATLQGAAALAAGKTAAGGALTLMVAALTRETLRTMSWTKSTSIAAMAMAVIVCIGGGWLWQSNLAADPAQPMPTSQPSVASKPPTSAPPMKQPQKVEGEPLKNLQGEWVVTHFEFKGQRLTTASRKEPMLALKKDLFTLTLPGVVELKGRLVGDLESKPATIDWVIEEVRPAEKAPEVLEPWQQWWAERRKGEVLSGVYIAAENQAKMCLTADGGAARPNDYRADKDGNAAVLHWFKVHRVRLETR